MKKYRVSLGMSVPANFEIETEAISETEAINIAVDTYRNGNYSNGVFTNPDWFGAKLDLGKNNSAVYVEELEEG